MISKLFIIIFILVSFAYSFLAAFSKFFYKDKPVSKLSRAESEILSGKASFKTRISLFFINLFSSPLHLPIYIIAGVLTIIFSLFL